MGAQVLMLYVGLHVTLLRSVLPFVHVGPENLTIGCPNLVQGDSHAPITPNFLSSSYFEVVGDYVQK